MRSQNKDKAASQEDGGAEENGEQEQQQEQEEDKYAEEHESLDYQIPEDVLRAAMLASPNTRASFWSTKMYRGPDGGSLSTHYCRSMEIAERVAQKFLEEKVVGFDIEWRPFSPVKNIKQNASLIQLACEDRIALFHVALFEGNTPEQLMPPSLKTILESPDILKVGVAVKGDFSRLQKYLNIEAHGVFELSRLHNLVELHATKPDKVSNKLVGLAAQVLQHLQLPLYKGAGLQDDPEDVENVRESDWSKLLNVQQIHYAAADAYAGFRLYHMLEWKRKQLRPTPPTRGLCDYDAKAVPRAKAPKKKKTTPKPKDAIAATTTKEEEPDVEQDQDEADEEDGYETAPEELMDSHELEDPLAATSTATANNGNVQDVSARETVNTQRLVGRVNLSWLKGPDPGYPALPENSQDSQEAASSYFFDSNAKPVDNIQDISPPFDPQVPQVQAAEIDESEDPELEEVSQTMELDVDGKLKEVPSAAVTEADEANTPHLQKDVNVTMREEDPIGTTTQDPTSISPPIFQPLAHPTEDVSHSPEYKLATTWSKNYLQSTIPSPTSAPPSRIRATVPHLRAYHLWHHQRLSLDDIAAHLRDPPLSHSTVSGYILQAVSLERLEYDKDAMRAMMMGMPTGLRKSRWKWMAEKVGALS
ncbi:hypothetical protein EK21DRAFT_57854 [Setomelanomma holmii]|uniref:3'-5' exonuclease domain-containing protein n=1 Tax=Setomelanomma holmii TaxID=210430 RepID=A0A9P4LR06_9PLEO|nr:hypothetical protein EK21DRAFT_57854 [Setomelanomma holmii]